eukprot:scaffold39080_cov56-Phaeocystis_antarctica.AAC.2
MGSRTHKAAYFKHLYSIRAVVGVSGARRTAVRPLLEVPATGAESRPDLRFPGSRVLAST